MFYVCIIGEGFFPYPVTDGNWIRKVQKVQKVQNTKKITFQNKC